MITHERMLQILRGLPEVKLELLELTWKVVGEDGKLDQKKIAFHYQEIERAISEAKAYSDDTEEMVECLRKLLR